MTQAEYEAQRSKLIAAMTGTQSVSSGGSSVVKRSITDILRAIQALDALARQLGLVVPAQVSSVIGRLYITGEGK